MEKTYSIVKKEIRRHCQIIKSQAWWINESLQWKVCLAFQKTEHQQPYDEKSLWK